MLIIYLPMIFFKTMKCKIYIINENWNKGKKAKLSFKDSSAYQKIKNIKTPCFLTVVYI